MLHNQNDQLFNEFDIVKWYIQVLESGHNTKTLLEDFILAQDEIKSLQEKLRKSKLTFEKQLTKKERLFQETKAALINLQKNVVKPLLHEVKIKDLLNKRLLD